MSWEQGAGRMPDISEAHHNAAVSELETLSGRLYIKVAPLGWQAALEPYHGGRGGKEGTMVTRRGRIQLIKTIIFAICLPTSAINHLEKYLYVQHFEF